MGTKAYSCLKFIKLGSSGFLAVALLFLIISETSRAEYRTYKLAIRYDEKQKKDIEVLTTLDDLQYATYYKITPTQTTKLIDHWMCRGRTDQFKRYCAKSLSKSQAPVAQAALNRAPPTAAPPPPASSSPLDSSPNPPKPNAQTPSNPTIMLQ